MIAGRKRGTNKAESGSDNESNRAARERLIVKRWQQLSWSKAGGFGLLNASPLLTLLLPHPCRSAFLLFLLRLCLVLVVLRLIIPGNALSWLAQSSSQKSEAHPSRACR